MVSIFIKKLGTKDGQGANGYWKKWLVTDQNDRLLDSWVRPNNPWNLNWKEGDTINVDESQIVPRDYNGKTYYTIEPVKKAGGKSGVDAMQLQVISDKLDSLNKKIDGIYSMLDKMSMNNSEPQF